MVDATAKASKLPEFAPKVTDQDSLIVSLVDVEELNMETNSARVTLAASAEGLVESTFVITADTFGMAEWATLQHWEVNLGNTFDFASKVPQDMLNKVNDIVERLLPSLDVGEAACTLEEEFDTSFELAWLCDRSYVERVESVDQSSFWKLTNRASTELKTMNNLGKPHRYLNPRKGLTFAEQTPFELHQTLLETGWNFEVCIKKTLPTYRHGDKMVFQLSPRQKRFSHGYMLCLLAAETHKLAVLPFQTNVYYKANMNGEVYVKKKVVKDCDFNFNTLHAPPPKKRQRIDTPVKPKRIPTQLPKPKSESGSGSDSSSSSSHTIAKPAPTPGPASSSSSSSSSLAKPKPESALVSSSFSSSSFSSSSSSTSSSLVGGSSGKGMSL